MLFTVIILIVAANGIADATGKFELKLISFKNKDGKVASGACCDARTGGTIFGCFGDAKTCDHRFVICIDDLSGASDDAMTCKYGRYETPAAVESNDIVFPTIRSSTFSNPHYVDFTTWPGGVRIKVEVWDEDTKIPYHEFVDRFVYDFTSGIGEIKNLKQVGKGKIDTSFEAELSVSCSPSYYGNDCSKHCVQQNGQSGHYTCDPKTGEKICLSGYSGASCTIVNHCASFPCNNGGTCTSKSGGYTCACRGGFYGNNCQEFVG